MNPRIARSVRILVPWILLLVLAVIVSGCRAPNCGDGICHPLEEGQGTCPVDCQPGPTPQATTPPTPPSTAQPTHTPTAPLVTPTVPLVLPEITETPPAAGFCGNAVCESGEDTFTCARDCLVSNISLLAASGLRAEWSPNGSKILYHKAGVDGYYDIYVMNADSSSDTCLTCNRPELANRNIGNGSWNPAGNLIAFQAQKAEHLRFPGVDKFAHPGVGYNHDLWLMTSDGQTFWRLTNLPTKQTWSDATPITAVLHPHFSNDGSSLSWGERVGSGGAWGEWKIQVADLAWQDNQPSLVNLQTYQPGRQRRYFETNDFSLDDQSLLICGNLELGQPAAGMDLYLLGLGAGTTTRLTDSRTDWDESGHFSPDQSLIAWISSTGYPPKGAGEFWWEEGRAEFWLMNADGTNKVQLTHFNQPGSVDKMGQRVMPTYISWNPDGRSLLASIIVETEDGVLHEKMLIIELNASSVPG